jgi:transcription initiation factor TFIIE subunit alpha
MYKSTEERKDYKCPRCKAGWTELEVLNNVGPEGFLCHRCGELLECDDAAGGESGGHEKQSRLMGQLDKLLKLLQQIDAQDIPQNDFESALAVAKPVGRNEGINPLRPTTLGDGARGPPVTVKGVAQAAPLLEINLTTNSEKTDEEQVAAAKRKAAIAAQNVVPQWIASSTVTGETTAVGLAQRDRMASAAWLETAKVEEDEKKDATVVNDELSAYYAQMQAEREKEAQEERDESSGDDEDDCENVGIDATSANTPSSSTSAPGDSFTNSFPNGILKVRMSESGSSNPGTGVSSPAGSKRAATFEDDGRPTKKVRLDTQENGFGGDKATPPDKISDEDDEAEFEDAL